MGRRGTQVAREAADVVLRDDSFASIVAAIRQGRVIAGNIRLFLVYLLSCNVSEILVVTGAAVVQAPLPILPLQILFLNLVTDVFPALALAFGEGDARVMERPPRPPRERILTTGHWRLISGYGVLIAASVLASLYLAVTVLGLEGDAAITLSFLTLAAAQLWHVFNLRGPGSGLLRNEITRNRWVWGALALCIVLLLAAVHLPPLSRVLRLEAPTPAGWLLVAGMSLVPLLLGQVLRLRPPR
jgi:Ca2+-transporting ATPase